MPYRTAAKQCDPDSIPEPITINPCVCPGDITCIYCGNTPVEWECRKLWYNCSKCGLIITKQDIAYNNIRIKWKPCNKCFDVITYLSNK
jgi:hypothetical protein